MNRKTHYLVLAIGIILVIIGTTFSSIALKHSQSRGGIDNTTLKINNKYYLRAESVNIEISKQEYDTQSILNFLVIIPFLLGFLLIFIFFVISVVYSVLYSEKYK